MNDLDHRWNLVDKDLGISGHLIQGELEENAAPSQPMETNHTQRASHMSRSPHQNCLDWIKTGSLLLPYSFGVAAMATAAMRTTVYYEHPGEELAPVAILLIVAVVLALAHNVIAYKLDIERTI